MKNKEKLIHGLIAFIIFTLVIGFLFNPYSINLLKSLLLRTPLEFNQIFVIQDDWIKQGIPLYKEFYRLLDTGRISWSWNLFLGNDFFVSKEMLYITSDIFAYLSYFINKIIHFIPSTLFIITMLKYFIAGSLFYWLLSCLKIKFNYKLIFSGLFIATGWSLIFIEHPIYISFYCLTPLLLISVEYILQKNKYFLMIISSALLIATSYYLAWTMCLYLLIYWCIRYFILNENNFKDFMVTSLKTLSAFIIGVLIAGVFWLPSLINLLNAPRLMTDGMFTYNHWSTINIISILMNFFIPVTKFDNSLYHDMWYYFYQIGIYSGILPILLIPQLFKQDILKKEKWLYGLLLLITMLTLISPFVGKIFHFTYSLRYTIIFNFTLLILGALSFNKLEKVNLSSLLLTETIVLALLITFSIILPLKNNINFKDYPEIKMMIVAIALSILYTVLLLFKNQKTIILIGILALIETIYQGNQAILSYSKDEMKNARYLQNAETVENIYQTLKEYDPTFYRVSLQIKEPINYADIANLGVYYNIPGLTTYDSLYNLNHYEFLQYMRQYPEVNWSFYIDEPLIFENLAAKYTIASTDQDLSYLYYIGEEVALENISEEYKVFKHFGNYSLAKTYNEFIDQDKVLEMSLDGNVYLHEISATLNNKLATETSIVPELNQKYGNTAKQSFDPISYDDNNIIFNIVLEEDALVYFGIPNNKGWKITCNNSKINSIKVNGGFIALELKKGVNAISINYTTPYLKTGISLSIIGLILSQIFNKKLTKYFPKLNF